MLALEGCFSFCWAKREKIGKWVSGIKQQRADPYATCINNGSPCNFQFDNGLKSRIRKTESDCHGGNHNHFHFLTSLPVGTDNCQRFHNADDCRNNGQSVMSTTTTVLATCLPSFNGNSNIDNNGNQNTKASNNSITCHSDHNSSVNTINDNSDSVCHCYIVEMKNFTKVAVPSTKMTSQAENLRSGSTPTKTTPTFGKFINLQTTTGGTIQRVIRNYKKDSSIICPDSRRFKHSTIEYLDIFNKETGRLEGAEVPEPAERQAILPSVGTGANTSAINKSGHGLIGKINARSTALKKFLAGFANFSSNFTQQFYTVRIDIINKLSCQYNKHNTINKLSCQVKDLYDQVWERVSDPIIKGLD
uniref:Uncharacterized protein n=1 Tax=Glossina austeni TaxID=7395 RepID=A0A1A9V9P7_GLOAU